jgi:hypothetical protein
MNEKELYNKTTDLRRELYNVMKEFWKNNKNISQDQVFFINSIVISSLVSQIVYMLFKKDIGDKPQLDYIDQICEFAKEHFKQGKVHMETGIQ